MRRIQSPEQMVEGGWYKIEVVESGTCRMKRYRVRFRDWELYNRKIRVNTLRKTPGGKWKEYRFYWEDLVSLEESYAS